jgi:hypothetical protein
MEIAIPFRRYLRTKEGDDCRESSLMNRLEEGKSNNTHRLKCVDSIDHLPVL